MRVYTWLCVCVRVCVWLPVTINEFHQNGNGQMALFIYENETNQFVKPSKGSALLIANSL